jgi:hypothetical protein
MNAPNAWQRDLQQIVNDFARQLPGHEAAIAAFAQRLLAKNQEHVSTAFAKWLAPVAETLQNVQAILESRAVFTEKTVLRDAAGLITKIIERRT